MSKMITLVNQMKMHGEIIADQQVVEKDMSILTP